MNTVIDTVSSKGIILLENKQTNADFLKSGI